MGKIRLYIFFLLFASMGFAQPYADIVNFTYQHFSSPYKDNPFRNQTDQYNINLFLPKEFKNGHVFLLRINSELIQSSVASEGCHDLSSIAVPVGFQFTFKSKKWRTIVMAIPKIASGFEGRISADDWQIGGLLLENYSPGKNLKFKAGLYYNNEAFGNFFVPLLGIDWKASERLNLYGTLPTNYKIEYAFIKDKWYSGLDFKSVTRSFNLSGTGDYVRFDETLIKLFAECFVYKNILISGQVGYSVGKNPLQYHKDSDELSNTNLLYAKQENYPVFNFGISYRIRNNSTQ